MVLRLAALVTLAVLAGCATEQRTVWVRDGSTQQEFNMDGGQCRAQAFSVAGVSMVQAAIVYESCMQGKGWQRRPA